ncbi:MAG: hypothetical protein JXR86_19030 [Spirochaetales bacterium]|nr:hypothetical protein [Spirochaetales bacterium]
MEKPTGRLKFTVFAAIFIMAAGGRWFNLSVILSLPVIPVLFRSAAFGAAFALPFYHIVDIFLANGLLQTKIRLAYITALFLIIPVFINRFLIPGPELMSPLVPALETVLAVAVALMSISADSRLSGKEAFIFRGLKDVPVKYGKQRFLLTVLETVFRLFPRPEPLGLYRIGHPDEHSIVLVTGNYELTIRRIVRSLKERDCWLLVCDSRGINIWCSTLAGHFGTGSIVNAVESNDLGSLVSSRKLLLPQLCAANVSLREIKDRTGFTCRFGPVLIESLDEFTANPGNKEI